MVNTIDFNIDYPVIEESEKLYEKALELIPCVTQTLAKGPGQYVKGVAPIYLRSGKGCHVIDVDGNEYIDYTMGVGPLSLGYCYPRIDDAIKKQLESGITFSLMHPLELEVAELIHEIIPNAESVRFSKTGADVTSAAVRLARAYTGKNTILCCGYHGWHDWYISVTDRDAGIPISSGNMTYTFDYNDIESVLNSIDDDTAAIILEPVVFEEPKNNFLHKLREICDEKGIILIFDEMWTGFRIALGGAQEYFGVKADLATYSKAVANGMPLAILAGKKEIMQLLEKEVFFFTTFGGETLSLAAAKETILELREKGVPEYLNRQGKKLKDGFNNLVEIMNIPFSRAVGFNFRSMIVFDPAYGSPLDLKSYFQQELLKYGILWSGYHNMSYSHHDDDINYTLMVYNEILPKLKKAVETGSLKSLILGETIQPVFRKVNNFNSKPKRQLPSEQLI